MNYIRITKDNIDKEHICCAMSNKQSAAKKEWLKQRFEEGLVFYRSEERGKCFIEYIPAEYAWVPIEAKAQGKKGLCILSAEGRKREFLSDPKYLAHKGFLTADTSECGITLLYLPFASDAQPPKFKDCAKRPQTSETGFVIYYTDQCPFTYYWVPRVAGVAAEHGIPLKTVHITDRDTAQNLPAPVTTYALFWDGKFVTHAIQSDKKFLKLAQGRCAE